MKTHSGRSIKRKLMLIIMATSTVALLLACAAIAVYELSVFRDNVSREATAIGQIMADSSTAALIFDDTEAAREVLSVLKSEPRVVAAAIYDSDGRIFARNFHSGNQDPLPDQPGADGVTFTDEHLELFLGVVLDGRRLGTVYLRSELTEMYSRAKQYAGIVTMVLLASLMVALAVSSILQKVISQPVRELAETASLVSKQANYELRAKKTSEDELGVLVERFNEMMEQIHLRDLALKRAQDDLEERVEERTSELRFEIARREEIQQSLVAAKEAAEEANRAKSAFLANMSHELRTPLNAIIGYSELLEETVNEDPPEEVASDLNKIHTAGRHLLTLIDDVLNLSKIEAGRMEIRYEAVLARDLIDYVVTTIRPIARQKGNNLVVRCDDESLEIETDVTRLRQSLLNLLSNACKFTDNGTVTLAARPVVLNGKRWVCWQVSDTGIGISPEDRAKLFKAFSQVDSSATRKHGGTGLGLAISRRLCQMLGGDITVVSEVGRGSTFSVWLPVMAVDNALRLGQTDDGEIGAELARLGRSLARVEAGQSEPCEIPVHEEQES
jgi:signal transduction histidine kinase